MKPTKRRDGAKIQKSAKRPRGRPGGARIYVHELEQNSPMRMSLGLPDDVLTYRDVARFIAKKSGIRVSLGTLYRFAHGIEPTRYRTRQALGLPPLVSVAACVACGVVHVAKRCPAAARKSSTPRRPRLNRRRLALELLGLLNGGRS